MHEGTMFYFSEALLLLLCATWGHAICSICVTGENGNEKGCPHHHVIQRLSDLPANCSSAHISLTSGNHSLSENLSFGDSVVINSTLPSQPTIIECRNGTGISFGRANMVNISNIVFSHCHTTIKYILWSSREYRVALYFQNAQYTLSNVAVINTIGYGLSAKKCKEQVISKCTFFNNSMGHVDLDLAANATVTINNTIFNNSGGAGVSTSATAYTLAVSNVQVEVSNSTFINNSIALYLISSSKVIISDCNFTQNRGYGVITVKGVQNVTLKRISLERNHGQRDCSVLLARKYVNLTLSNVNIANNNCTGIKLLGSTLNFRNSVNITGNSGHQGGALSLNYFPETNMFSKLTFTKTSKLNIINNRADTYGGGIYLEETCYSNTNECFFTLTHTNYSAEMFTFSGNTAKKGGDFAYGGCLSNCNMYINESDPNRIFRITNSNESLSNFLQQPNKVTFCANSTDTSTVGVRCNNSYTVSVYRGQTFKVPLMATDDFCTPSAEAIEATVGRGKVQLEHDRIQEGSKHCQNLSYTLIGGEIENNTTIAFNLQSQMLQLYIPPPVILTVQLKACPAGYTIKNHERCICLDILSTYKIECNLSTYSIKIPAQIWLGAVKEEPGMVYIIGVQKDCQYCHKHETRIITNITRDSDELCTNRTGILCGACAEGYSLKLGGYECSNCSNSTHKGVLLLISFAIIGIALVLLLLCLNLTVSTGMINALIFYSNIVYLNSEALLPISREGNSTHLQNTVRLLSTFQAWMNLDFGVTMCFFNGYSTYISTWMQFAFPLYIWLLILMIVLLSRYSIRISKLTTSNTVSVMLVYILPFTLLILLGPLLQAKSHYRLLKWINKLKPFLDAFYGPYTRRYRYWPGILLLTRIAILCNFVLFSPKSANLVGISLMVLVLVAWLAIGKTSTLSLHQNTSLNYIELFFLLNLGLFTAISVYVAQSKIRNQQGLAVAMVGSVLALSCGILVYHIYSTISKFRAVRKIVKKLVKKGKDVVKKKAGRNNNKTSESRMENTGSVEATHSLLEIAECDDAGEQLREPLLISDHDL